MKPDISLVIRAYNESLVLERLLENLTHQDYPFEKVELIVVDNDSTDNTAEVARKYGATVVALPQEDFNYPRSSNLGIAQAKAPIVGLLSAHAYPTSNKWITAGLKWYKTHPEVAGVWGPSRPLPDTTFAEKCAYLPEYNQMLRLKSRFTTKPKMMGSFPTIAATLRKDLWQKHPFDEAFGAGGEDTAWANSMMAQGHTIVCDVDMAVYHGHYLGWLGLIKQQLYWFKLRKPRPFKKKTLNYRKDIHHS